MTVKEVGEEGEKTIGRKRANEKIRSYLHHSQLETYTNNRDPRMGMFRRNPRDFDLFILWEKEGGMLQGGSVLFSPLGKNHEYFYCTVYSKCPFFSTRNSHFSL